MALAWAGESAVGLQIGAQRALTASIPAGWTATTDTATKKCWARGAVAEACLELSDRKGREPQAIVDAQKAGLEVLQCDAPVTEPLGAATVQLQVCKVRQGLQDQIRAWHVIVDGAAVGVGTFKLTAEDATARAEGDRFLGGLRLQSPEGATTRATPVCGALEATLGSSVDRFAAHRGAVKYPGVWTSTLPWPDAMGAPQIVEKEGKVSYVALVDINADAATAFAATQVFLNQLSACDTWCDAMTSAQTQNHPRRVEVSYTRTNATRIAPRCADARTKVILESAEDGIVSTSLVVEAP